jgi:hypothetical protein
MVGYSAFVLRFARRRGELHIWKRHSSIDFGLCEESSIQMIRRGMEFNTAHQDLWVVLT